MSIQKVVAIRKSPELVLVERGRPTASSRNHTKDNRPEVFGNYFSWLTLTLIVSLRYSIYIFDTK